jgi:hypothetical protein
MSDQEEYDYDEVESNESIDSLSGSSSSDDDDILDDNLITAPEHKESKTFQNLPEHLRNAIDNKLKTANLNMVTTVAVQRCGDISNGAQPTVNVDYKLKNLSEEKSYILKIFVQEVREKKCPVGVFLETKQEMVFLHEMDDVESYLKDLEYLISKDIELPYQ